MRSLLVLLTAASICPLSGCNRADQAPEREPPAIDEPEAGQRIREDQGTAAPADRDERFRRLVVGTWEDDYRGKRTMTLRPDGTGTMIVEPSGSGAAFAARLQFEMVWSVADGRLKKRTVGGKPAWKVNLILGALGDRVDEPILELTADRLLLLDKDGQTKYDWRRVRPDSE